MRAFISSIVVLVLISVAAAFGLNAISTSSQDAYTVNSNVRL
jgi:type II secretory pathway pseudopilin PulG